MPEYMYAKIEKPETCIDITRMTGFEKEAMKNG